MENIEKTNINVSVPLDILLDTGLSEKKAAMRMLKLFVMDLYKHNQISSGKAAELLGIRKYDFIQMMAEAGINYFNYSRLELEKEFKVIDEWEKKNV